MSGSTNLQSDNATEPQVALALVAASINVQFTGLTQNLQVDPAVRLKIPISALELTQILGQPCEFQVVSGGAIDGRALARTPAVYMDGAALARAPAVLRADPAFVRPLALADGGKAG
jgi:hypothetical protein